MYKIYRNTYQCHLHQTTPQEKTVCCQLPNWLLTYPLNDVNRNKEHETIRHILYTNKYDPQLLTKTVSTINTKLQTTHATQNSPKKQKEKWSTFTYVGPQTKFITKLFKNTNVHIAYRTDNTVEKLLTHHTEYHPTTSSAKFKKSGIYQLTCPNCNLKYIRQTGCSYLTRYQEHFCDYKYKNKNQNSLKISLTITTP